MDSLSWVCGRLHRHDIWNTDLCSGWNGQCYPLAGFIEPDSNCGITKDELLPLHAAASYQRPAISQYRTNILRSVRISTSGVQYTCVAIGLSCSHSSPPLIGRHHWEANCIQRDARKGTPKF